MQPWQVAAISRAKPELSAVCLAFLAELQKTAAKIDLPTAGARRVARPRAQLIDYFRSRYRQIASINDSREFYNRARAGHRAWGGRRSMRASAGQGKRTMFSNAKFAIILFAVTQATQVLRPGAIRISPRG